MTGLETAALTSTIGANAASIGGGLFGGGGEEMTPLEKAQKEELERKTAAAKKMEEYYTGGIPSVWTYVQPQNNPVAALMAYNLTQKGGNDRKGGLFFNWKGIGDLLKGKTNLKETPILNPDTQTDRQAYLAMAAQAPLPQKVYTPQQVQQQLINKQAPANNMGNPLASYMLA